VLHSESDHTVTNVEEFVCSAGQCFKFHAKSSVMIDEFNKHSAGKYTELLRSSITSREFTDTHMLLTRALQP